MKNFYHSIVIGNGIMAKQLMFELQKRSDDILCLHNEDFAPSCSRSSTAISCLRGAQKGISPLGDMIVDGFKAFESFVDLHRPDGVEKSLEVQTWTKDSKNYAKWLRRYKRYDLVTKLPFSNFDVDEICNVNTSAYLIDTDVLYSWYDKHTVKDVENDFVIKIDKEADCYRLVTKSKREFICTNLYICAGFLSKNFSYLCSDPADKISLEKQKQVYGNYLELQLTEGADYGFDLTKSFSDKNKNSFYLDKKILEDDFKLFCQKLNLKKLPPFKDWSLKQGIRCKGHKRIPFGKFVDENLFISSGLYKNAFSFAYLFSKDVFENN